jgi:hypothetical protein
MGAGWSNGDLSEYLSKVEISGNANMLEVGDKGILKSYELNGDGTCKPLPGSIRPSSKITDVTQKRVYVSTPGDTRNLRLYADKECETRANEETYMKKTKINNQNILYFPVTPQQNATHYKINDTVPNEPPLPYFMLSPQENAMKRFASDKAIHQCLPIPNVNTVENYNATMKKGVTTTTAYQRDLSSMTLYTDKDCTNIYTQTKEELDYDHESYYPYSTTLNPYTEVKGYGGRIMPKTNARYYKVKDEKSNVTKNIDPVLLAKATKVRQEREAARVEKEERDRAEALAKYYADEQLSQKAASDKRR